MTDTSLPCDECGEPLAEHEIYGKEEPPLPSDLLDRTEYRREGQTWHGVYCPN